MIQGFPSKSAVVVFPICLVPVYCGLLILVQVVPVHTCWCLFLVLLVYQLFRFLCALYGWVSNVDLVDFLLLLHLAVSYSLLLIFGELYTHHHMSIEQVLLRTHHALICTEQDLYGDTWHCCLRTEMRSRQEKYTTLPWREK